MLNIVYRQIDYYLLILNSSMVNVTYLKLNEEDYEKIFSVFYHIVGQTESREEFSKILLDLLTPSERIMLIKRIAVIYLLMKNINYQTICEVLKVSNGTVSKYKLLMERSEGIVPALTGMVKQEKVWLFFEDVFSQIFYPGLPGINWKLAWERKINVKRKKNRGL